MASRIHFNIGGMTCINCQNRIENSLNATDGVLHASVSFSGGTADIEYDGSRISEKEIIQKIEDLDYEVFAKHQASSFDVVYAVSILVIITALYYMLQTLGILNRLVPKNLADPGMGYGMLFMTGLITSVHCVAMCGGISISQSLPSQRLPSRSAPEKDGNQKREGGKLQTFLPSLAYNLGRVCSYTVIGWGLGLVGMIIGGGSEIGTSSLLQGVLKIIAGLFMVFMGINMLGIFPWIRRYMIHTPGVITRFFVSRKRTAGGPFAVGLLNGLMPCGPLQSMWIVALATGNPFAGALSMFLFSAGTVPLMLGLGSAVSALGKRFTKQVMKAGAVLVVVLGLSMISQGGSLSGWLPPGLLLGLIIAFAAAGVLLSLPERKYWTRYAAYTASIAVIVTSCVLWSVIGSASGNRIGADGRAQTADGIQVVNSVLASGSYPDITVQKGIPVRWTIEAPEGTVNGCNYRMLIQDYGIEHTFETGENVIEFVPEETGVVRYSCWMGMIHGNIHVV